MNTATYSAGAAPALQARDVHKVYGNGPTAFHALKGITLTVHEGESVAIVGKSGSGKSTLMHLLGLLDTPDSGSIDVAGEPTQSMSMGQLDTLRNRQFGFIFQQFYLNPTQSVLQNVVAPLKIAGVGRRERRRIGEDLLGKVGLADKAGNRSTDISGGQKQRVAVARALATSPRVIFADEPTGNLDTDSGALIEQLLFDLNQEQGITLVIVTHDQDLAERCARQVVMTDGLLADQVSSVEQEVSS